MTGRKMTPYKKVLTKISETRFVQSAMASRTDLSAFRERPTLKIILGLALIGFSYIIGLPGVAAMGALAVLLKKPLIGVIGGPAIYGLSHLVFIVGMYLAGAKYTKIFLMWATRVIIEKLMSASPPPPSSTDITPGKCK